MRWEESEGVDAWIARRNAERAKANGNEAQGRLRWADSTRSGWNLAAPRPSDVAALGGQASPVSRMSAGTSGEIHYGALTAELPSEGELKDLRRRQADFAKVARQVDVQNSWFAAPVLAAPLAAMSVSGLIPGAIAHQAGRAAFDFIEHDPYLRVGDNWSTRIGRRAHAVFKTRVEAKEGWKSEPKIDRPGQRPLRPDGGAPQRNPEDLEKRFFLELKPDTPTGRAAAARAVRRYKVASGQRTRAIFYDPKKVR